MIEEIINKIQKLQLQIERKQLKIMRCFKNNSPSSLHLLLQDGTLWHNKRISRLYKEYELAKLNRNF